MTLTKSGYGSRRHLAICFSNGRGSLLYSNIVEERADVRPGIRGRIVTIEAAHASIATIVSIAESVKTAKTGAKEFYLQYYCNAKLITF